MVAALQSKVSSFIQFSVASQNPQVRRQGSNQIPCLVIFHNVRKNFPPASALLLSSLLKPADETTHNLSHFFIDVSEKFRGKIY
jgi:hypothetical protein